MEEELFLKTPEPEGEKKLITKKWWFWTIIIVVAILIFTFVIYITNLGDVSTATIPILNSTTVPAGSPKPTIAPLEMATGQLFKEYDDNTVLADLKYHDKNIEVTGFVKSIDKDANGIFVILRADQDIAMVKCYFDSKNEKELANLAKGAEIKIKGICDGKMEIVILNKCIIG